jgi:hypothetical protein
MAMGCPSGVQNISYPDNNELDPSRPAGLFKNGRLAAFREARSPPRASN